MPPRRSPARRPHREASRPPRATPASLAPDLPSALAALEARASPATLAGMARYALPSAGALGVAVGDIQRVAKLLGQHHALAAELWQTGLFEARMLADFKAPPQGIGAQAVDCQGHQPFAIDDRAREQWMACMRQALDSPDIPAGVRMMVEPAFDRMTGFLRNR